METVFIVVDSEPDNSSEVKGVFSTRELADKFIDKIRPTHRQHAHIEEWLIDDMKGG